MSEPTHTPGPWKAWCRSVYYEGGDWPKSDFLQWEIEGPEIPDGRGSYYQADAQLIAAAPDLLEALKLAELWMLGGTPTQYSDQVVLEEIQSAIAKAKGTTND